MRRIRNSTAAAIGLTLGPDDHERLGRLTTIFSARQPCHFRQINRQVSLHRARHPTAPVGPLIETFVIGELAGQLALSDQPVRLYHYRDRDNYEVDAVLESATGDVVAVEVKAAETVRSEDFRGIQRLARRLGDQSRS